MFGPTKREKKTRKDEKEKFFARRANEKNSNLQRTERLSLHFCLLFAVPHHTSLSYILLFFYLLFTRVIYISST